MEKPIFTVVLGLIGVSMGMTDIYLWCKTLAVIIPTAYTLWLWRYLYHSRGIRFGVDCR